MLEESVWKNRCPRCRVLSSFCYCSSVSEISVTTPITVLMHDLEKHLTTNTVNLLTLAVPRTEVLFFGGRSGTSEFQLPSGYQPLVLYPENSATVLTKEYCEGLESRPLLIVPDGSWTQTRKLLQKRSNLWKVPRVKINRSEPSKFHLRKNQRKGGLCTLEAVAEALGVLESPHTREALLGYLDIMVERFRRCGYSKKERIGPPA